MKKRNLFGIFLFTVLLFSVMSVSAAPSISISTPANETEFSTSDPVTFNCSFDSDGSEISKVELFLKHDYTTTYDIIKSFNKGSFGEAVIGNNISTTYLDSGSVVLNPTTILHGSDDDDTCGGSLNHGCNLLNTTGGNIEGGYWAGVTLPEATFTVILNDTFLIHNFKFQQHETQYANVSKLEYSLDGVDWETAFEKTVVHLINEEFTTPFYAKYLKYSAVELINGDAGVNYGYYIDITGQVINSSTPFNDNVSYTNSYAGGDYDWYCKAFTDEGNFSTSNFTFNMNGSVIHWIAPTPANGTEDSNIVVAVEGSGDDNAYSFLVRDNSLIGWWTFDDPASRLASTNSFGSTFSASQTPDYINTTFGQSINLPTGSINKDPAIVGGNDNGFTLVFDMNMTNISVMTDGRDFITSNSGSGGFKFRGWGETNATHNQLIVYLYNDTGLTKQVNLFYPKSVLDEYSRYAFSFDFENQQYKMFANGDLIASQTTSYSGNFYDNDPYLSFTSPTGTNMTLDNILYFNISVTENEGELLSNYSKINTLTMDYSTDKNVTLTPYLYDDQGLISTSSSRDLNFLVSALITYTNLFNKDDTSIWAYCRGVLEGVTESLTHIIEYSFNGGSWIDIPTSYQSNVTWAIIGDSMYNQATDVPVVGSYMGFDYADMNSLAVAGWTCTQVNASLTNVADNTTHLLVGCGVNGGFPESNPEMWESIYTNAKIKNISNIYMSTPPPYQYINTLSQSAADIMCDRAKAQNAWLIDFASDKDDLFITDIFSEWNDKSGTNITDCGWNMTAPEYYDGTHPTTAGYAAWGEKMWNESFNQWYNNTYQANITPTESGDYDFRCYTNGNNPSLISDMGTVSFTYTAPESPSNGNTGGNTGGSTCSPIWDCNSWSFCSGGTSERTCNKLNSCSSNSGKPDTEKTCSVFGSIIEKIGSPVVDPIVRRLNCGAKPAVGEWGGCNSNDVTTRINYECTLETDYEWLSFTDEKKCSTDKGMLSSVGDFFTESIPNFFSKIWDFISFWN